MHLFEEHGVRDPGAAAGQIPVIDYGPYFAGAPGALERVAAEVAHACETIGFFYALNHAIPDELIDRAFAASRRFLPTKPMPSCAFCIIRRRRPPGTTALARRRIPTTAL